MGKLADNIAHFGRLLREAGLPVGPGHMLDAVRAIEVAGISSREDFRSVLHAVFVSKHEQSLIFHAAFDIFWKKRGFVEKLIAMMSPMAEPQKQAAKPAPGATRLSEAIAGKRPKREAAPEIEQDMRLTMSADDILQRKDFAQMTVDELRRAEEAIARMKLPGDHIRLRRFRPDAQGSRLDPRGTLRLALSRGGDMFQIARREPALRAPPIVALCDISGSMSEYTRVFLHFLHRLTQERRVETFLFGTRLTNVSRALRHRDIDAALAQISFTVPDWSGGTRIGSSLHAFNRQWSRRVLGQGATVLLFTDGLEREGVEQLSFEADRLHRSCRKLIWLNPLLRYDRFEPKASGIRAILPHVDEFRPLHQLTSLADLAAALSRPMLQRAHDPRGWMKRASA